MVREHPLLGAQIIESIRFLRNVVPIVRHANERWDGSGYPDGLAGEEIPLAARIFSVVDALDAMTTVRPYSPGVSIAQARSEIAAKAGSQFDPSVVAQLARLSDRVLERIKAERA